MSDLEEIKVELATLTLAEQSAILTIANRIRQEIARNGDYGIFALAIVGAEFAEKIDEGTV